MKDEIHLLRLLMTVNVQFLPDDVTIDAQPGEPLLEVAKRAGVFIPTGCLMGSCYACEVELGDGTPICACISSVPDGKQHLTIHLYSDPVW
ncbi:NADH:ubiquinone oxidoreductase chain G-like protein [Pleurocapsa sp. PCC 7327]|nr:NADH:ubiquinone oxidoreductase chain G-like protein [Pleurocapsa sp. PCC 7327]